MNKSKAQQRLAQLHQLRYINSGKLMRYWKLSLIPNSLPPSLPLSLPPSLCRGTSKAVTETEMRIAEVR